MFRLGNALLRGIAAQNTTSEIYGPSELIFFAPAVLISIYTLLFLPSWSVFLSYFILAVTIASVRENTHALGPHFLMWN